MYQSEQPSAAWLVFDNNKTIREKSVDVKMPLTPEDIETMHKLIDFVQLSQDPVWNEKKLIRPAVGLAAPQIGVNKKMYYIRIQKYNKNDEITTTIEHALVNPNIIAYSEQIAYLEDGEGCLSVKRDYDGIVPRSYKIIVEGYDYLKNQPVKLTVRGYEAIVFQHEQKHLEGILYYDLINKQDNQFKDPSWIMV